MPPSDTTSTSSIYISSQPRLPSQPPQHPLIRPDIITVDTNINEHVSDSDSSDDSDNEVTEVIISGVKELSDISDQSPETIRSTYQLPLNKSTPKPKPRNQTSAKHLTKTIVSGKGSIATLVDAINMMKRKLSPEKDGDTTRDNIKQTKNI